MQKKELLLTAGVLAALVIPATMDHFSKSHNWLRPTAVSEREGEEEEEMNPAKFSPWSVEDAARNQLMLEKFMGKRAGRGRGVESFANGQLTGEWINRGPKNMPGAFKFTEMLDGTDTIYGVTWNHYSGEYNSKSIIFKGTVYNSKTGTKGDDFVALTAHWPNRYRDLIAIKFNGKTRLIAGIENGPVYWSENDGATWTKSTGLPAVIQSSAAHRLDNNKIYATDGKAVYVSTDGGSSFTSLKDFGSAGNAALYAPRYAISGDDNLYLARSGTFYVLAKGSSTFTQKGTYGSTGGSTLRVGGDKRKLYVTESSRWWASTDNGSTWSEKYPKDNWYGERTSKMTSGEVIGANPTDPNWVIGGYAHAVYSNDGLNTQGYSPSANWGYYQGGTSETRDTYYNRIRFNYHPDFQSNQFFYNSTGDLFSAHSTDGGIFISYGYWNKAVTNANPVVNGYNSDYINITTLGTPCALIYRNNLFTGYKDEKHIFYSTQDQGAQSIIPGTSGNQLDFYQSIGGDGSPYNSADGKNVWRYQREGGEVWAPTTVYDGSGNFRSIASINNDFNSKPRVTFTKSTNVGWLQTYVDKKDPTARIWLLSKRLDRVTWNGSSLSTLSISKGTNQVAALAQGQTDGKKIWMLQDGKVYKSTNNGDSFDDGVATPFAKTTNGYDKADWGGGWVLPSNDNWILFAGPSTNAVGAILSKDGGATWSDVTGDLPYGSDFQVGGMLGSPDGKYVFAGTDLGPWVFVVAEEKWYPMGQVPGYFNTTAIEYIASTNTVRFGTWGAGVWDFKINANTGPFLNLSAPQAGSSVEQGASLPISWSTNQASSMKLELMQGTVVAKVIGTGKTGGTFAWSVPADLEPGTYTIRISEEKAGGLTAQSGAFTVTEKLLILPHKRIAIASVSSEESSAENGVAKNLLDSNATTIWHTNYSTAGDIYPHEIVFKSDTTVPFKGFSYLPRTGNGNGTVVKYAIAVSSNGSSWTDVASGTWNGDESEQKVVFAKSAWGSYVRFTALEEKSGQTFASGAEINLYYADEKSVGTAYRTAQVASMAITGIAKNRITLNAPSAGNYRVELFTLNGKMVMNKQLTFRQGGNAILFENISLGAQPVLIRIRGNGMELKSKFNLM